LLLIAPRQTTYQLERQLLADDSSIAVTHACTFSLLNVWRILFSSVSNRPHRECSMRKAEKWFFAGYSRKSATNLNCFAPARALLALPNSLSTLLRELQRNQLTAERLRQLAIQAGDAEGLGYKLDDLACCSRAIWNGSERTICRMPIVSSKLRLRRYTPTPEQTRNETSSSTDGHRSKPPAKARKLENKRQLQFALTLEASSEANSGGRAVLTPDDDPTITSIPIPGPRQSLAFGGLWVDGFSNGSPQELELLAALTPHCEHAALTFCLDRIPSQKLSWLSNWSVPQQSFESCKKRLEELPGIDCRG